MMMHSIIQPQRNERRNSFPVPNDIFALELLPGELAVYLYLVRCESRKTHQCWPSYKTIGEAVGMSQNTVRKYVCSLADKGLIYTENTSVVTRDGLKRNGNLLYTIQPFQDVLKEHRRHQLDELELAAERQRAAERLEEYNRRLPVGHCVRLRPQTQGPYPPTSHKRNVTAQWPGLRGRNGKQDKDLAPQAAPGRITSARSAGSLREFSGGQKWRLFEQRK